MIRDGNYVGDKLTAGEPVIGLVTRLFSPTVVELAGLTGFDYVWIDMEHGAASFETAENLVRATTGIDIISSALPICLRTLAIRVPTIILRSLLQAIISWMWRVPPASI